MNNLTKYIAESTMELKDVNICLSFIHTIWRDKPTMLVFNNLSNKIITSWFDPTLQDGDIDILEKLVINFLIGVDK